ncbi:hypothetical protein AB0H73_09950 [Streptomyces olivoreticuli]
MSSVPAVPTNPTTWKDTVDVRAEVQQLHDHCDALGRALAAVFNADNIEGGGWTHRAGLGHYTALDLLHPDGLGIGFRHEGRHRKGAAGRRLTVGGSYPSVYGGRRAQNITVSMDREPAAMARDVAHRLLPDYLATIGAAQEAARTDERNRQARIALNRRLEQVLPGLTPAGGIPAHEDPDRSRSYWSGQRYAQGLSPALASGHATVSTDASTVDLHLTGMPADLALRILTLINPQPVLEGTLLPRPIAPPAQALPVADRVIPGELAHTLEQRPGEPVPRY